ncbi:unnamed protein product [Ilex paraguariensis]|uniref:LysM domain-containing protein n=1 Tax=Ilex paraguariensis TaxID=185542 RepID=A0ABC8U822_9AQUA
MGFAGRNNILILCFVLVLAVISSTAQTFTCSSGGACKSMVGYVSPNTTTLDGIKTFFGVKNLRSILGANNLPLSTLPNTKVFASQTIKIPFNCLCTNGTGISNGWPIYTVIPDDGLFHIASEVFAGLVTVKQIQAVNKIENANVITVGQELQIPLPCSCDEVDGEKVVHYGLVVAAGSTVEGIAQQYNTTQDTLLRLNKLASPNDLIAGVALDVPLKGGAFWKLSNLP